jgi:precorrin-6B methylase 1
MNCYTDPTVFYLAGAVETLPGFVVANTETVAVTGTDGNAVPTIVAGDAVANRLVTTTAERHFLASDGTSGTPSESAKNTIKQGRNSDLTILENIAGEGDRTLDIHVGNIPGHESQDDGPSSTYRWSGYAAHN